MKNKEKHLLKIDKCAPLVGANPMIGAHAIFSIKILVFLHQKFMFFDTKSFKFFYQKFKFFDSRSVTFLPQKFFKMISFSWLNLVQKFYSCKKRRHFLKFIKKFSKVETGWLSSLQYARFQLCWFLEFINGPNGSKFWSKFWSILEFWPPFYFCKKTKNF